LAAAHAAGGKVIAVTPRHETLEDLFLRRVADQGATARCCDDRVAGPDLGDRAQHVPRGRADQGAVRDRDRRAAVNLLAIALGEMSVSQQSRVARDFGIAGISLFGSLTAIFVGIVLLYGEIQKRTIYSIISKPLARWEFVVGKYLGMVLVLTALVAAFALAMAAVLAYQGVAHVGRGRQGAGAGVVRGADGGGDRGVLLVVLEPVPVGHLRAGAVGDRPGHARPARGDRVERDRVDPWVAKGALIIVPDLHVFSISGGEVDGQHVSVNSRLRRLGLRRGRGRRTARCGSRRCLVLACAIFRKRDFV
jgi:hypothetical protein